jgi:hypothetical protein
MNAYIFQADIFCADCGRAIRKQIKADGFAPENPRDENTYDSDEYPKGPFSEGGGAADCPNHCGAGADCLNAITLADGHKIGAWLENDLTSEGAAYVREAVAEGGDVAELWALWYSDEL